MEKFVLDTNLFFNMEPGLGLGRKTEEVIRTVTRALSKVEVYMPPSIVAEFLSFFEDKKQDFLKEFLAAITSKSPDINKVDFHASVFYKLVADIRDRSYRGLTIAEEAVKKAVEDLAGKSFTRKQDFEQALGPVTKNLRERYRQATRTGFLDSVADLDLITLAKELDAVLVSTDEGVIKWGRDFGVKEMEAATFGAYLTKILR